jgi:hypothetical protein
MMAFRAPYRVAGPGTGNWETTDADAPPVTGERAAGRQQRRGAPVPGAPLRTYCGFFPASRRSGERRFAVCDQQVLVCRIYRQRVVLFLEPDKLGLQVTYSLLQTAHLGYHTRIGTADVAK